MARMRQNLLALGVLTLCGSALASCGNGVPAGSIAKVANATISKTTFDHWILVAQKSASAPGTPIAPLDPPSFSACVAFHQANDPKPAKGQPNPTPAALKMACQQIYNAARDQVVHFLVTADWLQGEGADEGIKVTDADVTKSLATIAAQQFPTPAKLAAFLTGSGETRADLLYRVRIEAFTSKLTMKATSATPTVTPAAIADYYNHNLSQFGTPEVRDLRIVLLKTAAQANHVHALLAAGQSFAKIAKQYSVDQATRPHGGALVGVQRGQQDPALDAAIFSAQVGRLVGPIKTPFGYEIFRLQKITPATKKTLAQESALIRQNLILQDKQAALMAYGKKFEAKWRSRTTCAASFVTSDCSNGPKPTRAPASTSPSGTPQPQPQTQPSTTAPATTGH